ncbi:nucleotidyltransferase domain-containing protein [Humibacter soli]
MDDEAFVMHVGDSLAGLPGVEAVTLGGSRAEGTNRPDSDWDFSLYYRGHFDPQDLRDLGWPGEVSELGGWSSVEHGVFNGGAWLEIDGRRSDVHYRDLDVIDRVIASAREGRFEVEPLWFHLAGIPSYLVLAELATKRVIVGELPEVEYPDALREKAPARWWDQADAELGYARSNHAAAGRLTQCVGLVARAASCAAHAILAAKGVWVTNEKQLFARAGLGDIDLILAEATSDPAVLVDVVDRARAVCEKTLSSARATTTI